MALAKSDLKDPLIDLEAHDIVDIVRIYATFAQSDDSLAPQFVPKLFADDAKQAKSKNTIQTVVEDSLSTSLQEMSIELLKTLQDPIIHKLEPASIANISDVLFAYSSVSPNMLEEEPAAPVDLVKLNEGLEAASEFTTGMDDKVGFVHQVQKALSDKIILHDMFNTFNSAKALWALSRYQARSLTPSYHLDVCNVIMSRQDLGKVSSVSHQIYEDINK